MWVGSELDVPHSKWEEISQQSSTEREKCLALGDYWVNTDPDASWERLATVIYYWGEERAVAVAKQYLQQEQGVCNLCLPEMSVYILTDTLLPVTVVYRLEEDQKEDHFSHPKIVCGAGFVLSDYLSSRTTNKSCIRLYVVNEIYHIP